VSIFVCGNCGDRPKELGDIAPQSARKTNKQITSATHKTARNYRFTVPGGPKSTSWPKLLAFSLCSS